MHDKMFMFSNTTYGQVWAMGSFHPTEYAANYQFNDLVFAQNQCIHTELRTVFYQLAADKVASPRRPVLCGRFYLMVYPQPNGGPDMFIEALDKLKCTGAAAGYGKNGHSVIRVQQYAMSGHRAYEFAAKLKILKKRGCVIDMILGPDRYIADTLLTDPRYLKGIRYIQRTVPGSAHTHLKSMLISGNYYGNRASRLVYTGSLNMVDGQNYRDEMQLRIADSTTYLNYVAQVREVKRYYNKPLPSSL
jgi:hypothetical protein